MLRIMTEEQDYILGELIYVAHTLSPKFKELLLLPTQDVHYGNPLFSKHHFLEHIGFIDRTPNAVTVLNGDLCESSLRTSKGDIFRQVGTPQDQRDWIITQLRPLADKGKILSMTTGNHENRIYNETGIDISKDIAKELNVPYRPEGLLVKISVGSGNSGHDDKPYVYWVYHTHGYGGARTKASKAVKVERTATWIDADVYIMAHDHVVNVAPDVYLMPDSRTRTDASTGFTIGTITAHRKMLVKANAFIKWGGYSEMLGFPPVDLETPVIKFACTGYKKPIVKVEI